MRPSEIRIRVDQPQKSFNANRQEHEERTADLAGQIAVLKRAAEDAEGRTSRAQIETAVSHAVQECQVLSTPPLMDRRMQICPWKDPKHMRAFARIETYAVQLVHTTGSFTSSSMWGHMDF